jgi:antitoxin component YwqK of YwqJK toxin-antitoxin module
MKAINYLILIILIICITAGCTGKGPGSRKAVAEADTVTVPDTGYTGIRQYFSKELLVKEVTFKNGVRHGEMKTYYMDGKLYQTFWYENGLREDSARWYYTDGKVFRSTPYKNDTIHGIQKQYYRNGRTKAKMEYNKGLRTLFFEEYAQNGALVKNYPEIVFTIRDDYNSRGVVRVNLELSNKATRVKFYTGEFYNGVFDTSKCILLPTNNGKAYVDLKKTGTPQKEYIGIIAQILTSFSNNYLAYKRIDLPYKDLK